MAVVKFLMEALNAKEIWEINCSIKHEELLKNPSELVAFMKLIEDEYLKIKKKYCTENVKFGGIGYSKTPELSLEKIEISIVEEKKTSAILKVQSKGSPTYYLYSLKLIDMEWKINNIQMITTLLGTKSKGSF